MTVNHLWVIEMWTGTRWEPTYGVEFRHKDAVKKRQEWELQNPDAQYRVKKYIATPTLS